MDKRVNHKIEKISLPNKRGKIVYAIYPLFLTFISFYIQLIEFNMDAASHIEKQQGELLSRVSKLLLVCLCLLIIVDK
jgi:hypothetical protein